MDKKMDKQMDRTMDMRKDYWFTIETYVHVSLKRDGVLFYNSLNGKALEYSRPEILALTRRLLSGTNLQTIRLRGADLQNPVISGWVAQIREHMMGDLIDTAYSSGKPVQMMPILKIRTDVKYLKKDEIRSVGEDLLKYINEIFLYINDGCGQNCFLCRGAYKQFPCCTTAKSHGTELDFSLIERLSSRLLSASLINFNILGGNIFRYSRFRELSRVLEPLHGQKTFHFHYANLVGEAEKLGCLDSESSSLDILVPPPVNTDTLKKVQQDVMAVGLKHRFLFVVRGEEDFEQAEGMIASLGMENYDFRPYFTGDNLDFFRENVFTTREEVLESQPSLNDLYVNSVVNSLNFGRLTIMADGGVHANVNRPRLGVLGKDLVYNMLYKEMYHGKSWRRVRKHQDPCRQCVLQTLCPPLSNYSFAIGRNNLCDRDF